MSGQNITFKNSSSRWCRDRAAASFSSQFTKPGEDFSAWATTIKLTSPKKYVLIAAERGDDKNLLQLNEAIQQNVLWHQSLKTPLSI
jgi:hypothetical protein